MTGLQSTETTRARLTAAPPTGPQPGWSGSRPVTAVSLPPPPPPRYSQGTMQVPSPALQVASYTGSSSGGAPGANFGPPGVGNAPVILGVQLTPLNLLVVGGVVFVAWRLLR